MKRGPGLAAIVLCVFAHAVYGFNADQVERIKTTNACSGCNLSGADLNGVDLSGARLVRADLSDSNLGSAMLTGADLINVGPTGSETNRDFCIDFVAPVRYQLITS